MTKKFAKYMCLALIAIVMPCCIMFSGCSTFSSVTVKSFEYDRTEGLVDYYIVTYTDGSTYEFKVTNGANGKDADKVTLSEAYEDYKTTHEGTTLSYEDFVKAYLTVEDNSKTQAINKNLLSSVILYSEFKVTESVGWTKTKTVSRSGGSGVVYKIDEDKDEAYIITNYHVVYSSSANSDNGGNIAYRIVGYLYGSESANGFKTDKDSGNKVQENGYYVFDYGDTGIEFTYIGGSVEKDIAILKTSASKLKEINNQVRAVEFADSYTVGETAIAIGNAEGQGISVTEGIISVDSEYIDLSIDTTRTYRSMRIDTSIYHGNSGGGLYNEKGQLIGITNSGDETDENINYAIPLSIVKNTVENIMYYYNDGDDKTNGAYKITLGVEVSEEGSKFVYNAEDGTSKVEANISVAKVNAKSIAETMGIKANDVLLSFYIDDKEYALDRSYEVGDLLLTVRVADKIGFKVLRGSETIDSDKYVIQSSDLVALA